jgi:hypothetical protein
MGVPLRISLRWLLKVLGASSTRNHCMMMATIVQMCKLQFRQDVFLPAMEEHRLVGNIVDKVEKELDVEQLKLNDAWYL